MKKYQIRIEIQRNRSSSTGAALDRFPLATHLQTTPTLLNFSKKMCCTSAALKLPVERALRHLTLNDFQQSFAYLMANFLESPVPHLHLQIWAL